MDTDPGPSRREPAAAAEPAAATEPAVLPSSPSYATLTLRRRLHGRPARRRELCLWLGAVASWRQGLVKRLVKEYGSVGRALDRNAGELRAAIGRPGYRPRRAGEEGRAGKEGRTGSEDRAGERNRAVKREAHAAERSEEEARLAAVLATDPARYAAAGAFAATGQASTRATIAWCDPLYPPALRQLSDPPLCLFVRAECTEEELVRRLQCLCSAAAVAVVGTRSPSPYGHDMATVLGRDLTRSGLVVVSGLAMGIDAAAQAAALGAAGPATELATVGVLGCGADVVYPRQNADLFRAVGRRGLLVSEFVWGVPARPWRFPARNRVMAALSRGVVIVEGAARSGARLTADFALDLGREVLAVPGEAGRRLTAAPHEFLRDGATLCESAADVTAATASVLLPGPEELAGDVDPAIVASLLQRSHGPSGPLAAVAEALGRAPMTIDQVAAACGIAVQEAAALLSELEVDGLVRVTDGGVYRLRA